MLATSDDLRLAVDLYKDSNAAVVNLWTVFAAVALPLLVFVLSSKDPIPFRAKIWLVVILAAFAGSNASSMWHAQLTLQSAAQAIHQLQQAKEVGVPSALQQPLWTLEAHSPLTAVAVQVFLSAIILGVILFTHFRAHWFGHRSPHK